MPPAGEDDIVLHLTPEQCGQDEFFRDKDTGGELEVTDRKPLLEWLAETYKKVRGR